MDDQVWPAAAVGGGKVIQDLGETFSDCRVGDGDGGGMDVEGDAAVLGAVLGGGSGEGEVGREGGRDEVRGVDEVGLEGLRMVTRLVPRKAWKRQL